MGELKKKKLELGALFIHDLHNIFVSYPIDLVTFR